MTKKIRKLSALTLCVAAAIGCTGCNTEPEQSASSLSLEHKDPESAVPQLSGSFSVKDAPGVTYQFEDTGICYYKQEGTYSFDHDTNHEGVDADLLNIQFETQENPSVYTLEPEEDQVILRTTYSGKEAETTLNLKLLKGENGLPAMECFDGTYSVFDLPEYRYTFRGDGSCALVLEEQYALDGNQFTLSGFGQDQTYELQKNEEVQGWDLVSEGITAAILIPVEE